MARPDYWYHQLDARIARAKELGWSADLYGELWVMNDPDCLYSGLGDSERDAFIDVLADAELWDEISELLFGEVG